MINDRNCSSDAGFMQNVRRYNFTAPLADTNLVVSNFDLNGAVAGDLPALVAKTLPVPMSLFATATDAVGTNLSVTIQVSGRDFHGAVMTQEVTVTGAATTAHTLLPFREISKVEIVAISNNTVNDKLNLGITANSSAMSWGLPLPLRKSSSTGAGGDRDTVQDIYKNGAVQTGWNVLTEQNAITGVILAAGSVMVVTMDPDA